MGKRTRKVQKKEEIAEDWCFDCKDGGELRICDYKHCPKAYHPECVKKDDSFLTSGKHWTCGLHCCFFCHNSSDFHCYCCPTAVCRHCIKDVEFVCVRGKKGFCRDCLKLVLLIAENKDVDSDGEKVDFEDRETYETLFKEYWVIINWKEGLTLENLQAANDEMKRKSYKSSSDSGKVEDLGFSDSDDIDSVEEIGPIYGKKRSKGKPSVKKGKTVSNRKEFIGWGSRILIQFLASIGKSVSKELSQYDVTSIINEYIKENKLYHPVKKRMVECDARLQSVLGRKVVNRRKIYDYLDSHFAENQEPSEKDESGYSSEEKNDDAFVACKRQRKSSNDKKFHQKEMVLDIPQIHYASIIPDNINLVYLRRTLVQKLLEKPETFESKVVGSFVKIKYDPFDFFQKNTHHLVQVTGTKIDENNAETLLQVSGTPKDISISLLSDSDVCQEECEELKLKVKGGLLKRPTVVELEQKARSLHEDITKQWITRELRLLQLRIDQANEKGWRRELFEYLRRRQLLETSAEQSRLLQMVRTVIPDVAESEPIPEVIKDNEQGDGSSPKSIRSLETPHHKWEGNIITSGDVAIKIQNSATRNIELGSAHDEESGQEKYDNTAAKVKEEKEHPDHVSVAAKTRGLVNVSAQKDHHQNSTILAPEIQNDVDIHVASEDQINGILSSDSFDSGTIQNQATDVDQGTAKIQQTSATQLVDNVDIQEFEDLESCVWYCIDPRGKIIGPQTLSFLGRWREVKQFSSQLKVWKIGQTKENAVLLNDVVALLPGE